MLAPPPAEDDMIPQTQLRSQIFATRLSGHLTPEEIYPCQGN